MSNYIGDAAVTDALGNVLMVGDRVGFVNCQYNGCFENMDEGTISKIGRVMITITHTKLKYFNGYYTGVRNEIRRKNTHVVKL